MLPTDCIRGCIRPSVPQPTEWQRIGNQINAAFIASRSDFVKMHEGQLERVVSRLIFRYVARFWRRTDSGLRGRAAGICSGFARMIAAMRS
jgi:hypothetical protein